MPAGRSTISFGPGTVRQRDLRRQKLQEMKWWNVPVVTVVGVKLEDRSSHLFACHRWKSAVPGRSKLYLLIVRTRKFQSSSTLQRGEPVHDRRKTSSMPGHGSTASPSQTSWPHATNKQCASKHVRSLNERRTCEGRKEQTTSWAFVSNASTRVVQACDSDPAFRKGPHWSRRRASTL